MPQGITYTPSTFQCLMKQCMGDVNLKELLVFIDDLILVKGGPPIVSQLLT